MNDWVNKALEEKKALTPTTGFNVVAVDDFAEAGEALYLVGHYETAPDAEAAREKHMAETSEATYVYSPGMA